jgi:hypothetical protein
LIEIDLNINIYTKIVIFFLPPCHQYSCRFAPPVGWISIYFILLRDLYKFEYSFFLFNIYWPSSIAFFRTQSFYLLLLLFLFSLILFSVVIFRLWNSIWVYNIYLYIFIFILTYINDLNKFFYQLFFPINCRFITAFFFK